MTQDYNAVEKWTLTAHLKAAANSNFCGLCEVSQLNEEKELSKKVIIESENVVTSVKNIILEHCNPFCITSSKREILKNIYSGCVVKDEHRSDILNDK